jgi:two-component system CheB/CheR fusion protein
LAGVCLCALSYLYHGPSLNSSDLQLRATDVEAELATILEGIGEAFYAVDREWRIRRFNREAARHFGRAPHEVVGRNLWDAFPGARETPLGQLFLDTMARREPIASETQSVVVAERWLAYRLFPLGDGMGVVFRDITDRKRAEQQRDLLIKELQHRVNNTLATVQAIAAQTFHNSGVDLHARQTFEARLLNLANAHTALTNESWDSVALRDLILSTLRPYGAPNPARFSVSGPDVRVQPKSAVALSMAIHELSTNAAKYGALSVESGRVAIGWTVTNGRFRLRWQEHGGPPVSPPTRKGFGSIMIERVLAEQLGGGVTISYDASGVVCSIDVPFDAIQEPA